MSVRVIVGHSLAATTIMAGSLAGTAVAAEAAAPATVTVQAGRAVLTPGDRGYQGSLPVAVTYQGDAPSSVGLTIVEPVAGAYQAMRPDEACVFGDPVGNRRTIECVVPGGDLAPGERRRFAIDFAVLTAPRAYAMQAADTTVSVNVGAVRATASSPTLFRSTTGSLRNPQAYVQDSKSDLTVTAGSATLTAQEDGTYAGRVPVTVHWAGDAPHYDLGAGFEIPAGFDFRGLDPDEVCAGTGCLVPGGRFAPGETRTFHLLATAPADAVPGTVGTGSVTVSANWQTRIEDVDPSDDTAGFTLTVG